MKAHKLHFIGIGGVGMSAIAKIMLNMGYEINGSDLNDGPLVQALREQGAHIYIGHDAANIGADIEAVVYSSAIKPENPELLRAQELGLPVYQRAEMLAFLMSLRESIGVAGAHGKTTTSGMLGLTLEKCGLDPTIIIGGTLPQIGGNAKSGRGKYLVAEADESDATFLLLRPKVAVVTNIECDHLDHYECFDNIVAAFTQYLQQLPKDGLAIICGDCENCRNLLDKIPAPYLTYGLDESNDYYAKEILHQAGGVSANIYEKGQKLGRLFLQVPGNHNVTNALAVVAFCRHIGLHFSVLAEALGAFQGTGRRYDVLGKVDDILVIDDYAHHPTEIKATIQAAKDSGAGRIVAVFQPHRYSRTLAMCEDFADAFDQADVVILNEIYGAFEKPIPGVTAHLIEAKVKEKNENKPVEYAATLDDTLDLLRRYAKSGDVVLIMGAGNIRIVGQRFVDERK